MLLTCTSTSWDLPILICSGTLVIQLFPCFYSGDHSWLGGWESCLKEKHHCSLDLSSVLLAKQLLQFVQLHMQCLCQLDNELICKRYECKQPCSVTYSQHTLYQAAVEHGTANKHATVDGEAGQSALEGSKVSGGEAEVRYGG